VQANTSTSRPRSGMSAHSWEHFEPVGMRYPIDDRAAMRENRHVSAKVEPPPPEKQTPPVSKRACVTPKYVTEPIGELMYFPLRARGEAQRFILHYAGLSYYNRVVEMGEWGELKPTTPKGALPVFTPQSCGFSDEPIAESLDIAKYLASVSNVTGLMPTDAAAVASADSIFEKANGPLASGNPLLNMFPAEEARPKVPAYAKEAVGILKGLEPQLKGTFFGGSAPHYGDFGLMHAVDVLKSLDPAAYSSLGPKLTAWFEAMCALPRIKEYLKCRAQPMSGNVGVPGSIIATSDTGTVITKLPSSVSEGLGR